MADTTIPPKTEITASHGVKHVASPQLANVAERITAIKNLHPFIWGQCGGALVALLNHLTDAEARADRQSARMTELVSTTRLQGKAIDALTTALEEALQALTGAADRIEALERHQAVVEAIAQREGVVM